MRRTLTFLSLIILATISSQPAKVHAAELYGLQRGTVELKSGGPLAFGPSGILFIGDPMAAKIYAVNTEDEKTDGNSFAVANLGGKISSALDSDDVKIADMAVEDALLVAAEHLADRDVEQEDRGLEQRQADQALHQVSGGDDHIEAGHHQDDDRDVVEAFDENFQHAHHSSSGMSGTRPAKA